MYEKIKELCSSGKTTISALERKLEFGNGTIHRWKIVSPSVDKLQRVADYFGVTVDYLLSASDISPEAITMVKKIDRLNENQRQAVLQILNSYSCEKGKEKNI